MFTGATGKIWMICGLNSISMPLLLQLYWGYVNKVYVLGKHTLKNLEVMSYAAAYSQMVQKKYTWRGTEREKERQREKE